MSTQTEAGQRILVVEDDVENAEMLTAMLESEGYRVQVAPTAQAARALLARSALDQNPPDGSFAGTQEALPDLILLDLLLPDQEGTSVITQLTETVQPLPPVIVLSAKMEGAVTDAAHAIGAADALLKPFDMATLLASIAAVLARPR